MRIALRSALVLAALGAASAAFAAPKDPTGTWLTEDGRAKVRIDRCGPSASNICGKVVWLKTPTAPGGGPRTDLKNPDPKKRNRPVIGLTLLDNLQPEEAKFSGEIYNAEEGKMYSVSLERESASELNISGCLLKVLCGSQTWNRVPDVNQQAAMTATDPKAAAKPAVKAAPQAEPED
ncbi:DUF2147 domain-containing protein [Methylobacterium haplocladii]|uniref:DUF2147 domain-containing protein n=1 Tax=Methylobacterium haplocladii TaxID=1176176 RepID=A0A512IT99_9HYPH|nr:DUF2147 domain-containing protein [Methylobacterium haplocladii]GEP00942.1 hypothetical protein MHA02_33290 [Methylobacterium haplocladii]GJD84898.1 hypothetical protein HPGCJGGD_2781 [Methylobacterium haplocladii]GLS59837.1 hypothetical protein GCM10007887_25100 [Methylobacterium haplocladii]